MSVIEFKPREPKEYHAEGAAVCLHCRHEWRAVAPVGTLDLECPSCALPRGVWKYNFGPIEGDTLFTCNCGCEAMNAYYRQGVFRFACMACGADQTAAVFS